MEPKKRKPRAKKVKVIEAPAAVIPETLPESVTEVLTEGESGFIWLPILVAILVAFTLSGVAYWYVKEGQNNSAQTAGGQMQTIQAEKDAYSGQ